MTQQPQGFWLALLEDEPRFLTSITAPVLPAWFRLGGAPVPRARTPCRIHPLHALPFKNEPDNHALIQPVPSRLDQNSMQIDCSVKSPASAPNVRLNEFV